MNAQEIIDRYYPLENELKDIFMIHARAVTQMALDLAKKHPELKMDLQFIEEAAMLHDLGIFLTDAPRIHCYGNAQYLCHGYLGAELLRSLGYERHARVCERHTGTGLKKEQILANGWDIPAKDLLPETLEEQLICFADKFYSKTKYLYEARTFEQVKMSMAKISASSVEKIEEWQRLFG